jgi:hypothetical protein
MNETKIFLTKTIAFLSFAFLLFFSTSLQAVTINWVGSSGSWFDTNNWSTGTIPTLADEVIINNGRVIIDTGDAEARNVEVGPNSELYIDNRKVLEIEFLQFMTGLENHGYIVNMGVILISNPTGQTNAGFDNHGTFHNRGGIVEIFETGVGYKNNTTGVTTNDGTIRIYDMVGMSGGGLSNRNLFTNEKGAEIHIYNLDLPSYAISNFGTSPNFYNHGDILVENCPNMSGEAIQVVEGLMQNENDGTITIDNVGNSGLTVSTNGTFRNKGLCYLYYCGSSGLITDGFFVNHQKGKIYSFYHGGFGAWVSTNGELRNFGVLYAYSSGSSELVNNNIFNNYPKGKFFTDGHILNNGYFHNMGTMDTFHPGSHTIVNALNNTGVIGDRFDAFGSTQINNNGVVVKPIYGNVEVGVPAANALDLGSLSNVTLFGWTIAPSSSTSAGTYNASTNEFTPNANAAGLSEIYVTIRVNNSGLKRKYLVPVPNGIQNPSPRVSGVGSSTDRATEREITFPTTANEKVLLFPNPSTGAFRLKSEANTIQQIRIISASGQVVFQEEGLDQNGTINLTSDLPDGLYQVVIINGDGSSQTVPLKLIR